VIKGFREFIMRGSVIDLAVAVVIGGAFGAIVTKFVESIINPLVAALGGSNAAAGLGFFLRHDDAGKGVDSTFVNIGDVITATINFVLIALVVYLVLVVPMNKLQERRNKGLIEAPEAPAEDVIILTEIRDLLRAQNRS
jgi:large conductance mechanosensitive channel